MSEEEPKDQGWLYDLNDWLNRRGVGVDWDVDAPLIDHPKFRVDRPDRWLRDKVLFPLWDKFNNQKALREGVTDYPSGMEFLRGYWDYTPIVGAPSLGEMLYGDLPTDPGNWLTREFYMTSAGIITGTNWVTKLVGRRVAGFIYDNWGDTWGFPTSGDLPHYSEIPSLAGSGLKNFFIGSKTEDSGVEKMIKVGMRVVGGAGGENYFTNKTYELRDEARAIRDMRDGLQPTSNYTTQEVHQLADEARKKRGSTRLMRKLKPEYFPEWYHEIKDRYPS